MIPISLSSDELKRAEYISIDVCGKIDKYHLLQTEVEMVVCKFLDITLNKSFLKAVFKKIDFKNDAITSIKVVFYTNDDNFVIFDTDSENTVFVIVSTIYRPTFIIRGWNTGKKLMKNKYKITGHDGSYKFLIPVSELNAIEDLKSFKKVKTNSSGSNSSGSNSSGSSTTTTDTGSTNNGKANGKNK
jgi:hypothetical protein